MAEPFVVTNLPPGLKEPGVYVQFVTDGDAGLSAPNNRCLLAGYMTPGYPGIPDVPARALSQLEVDVLYGPKSMLSQAFAAAKAQVPIGMECHLLPLMEPSGGTASVYNVEFAGEPASGVLSAATAAAAADVVYLTIRGRGVAVSIKKDDDWTTIATNAKTAWDNLTDPPAACSRSGAVLSFTANHKGDFDNGAIEVTFASLGQSGVAAILGTMTVSGAAGAAGTVLLRANSKALSLAVANADTAIATGSGIVSKVNGTAFPVRAAQPGTPTGTVTLFYVNKRPVRPLTVSSTETGLAPQAVADAVGTKGVGVPSLTTALTNMTAVDDAFRAWAPFWRSVTELGQLATHIEAQAAVPIMKGQVVCLFTTQSFANMASANVPASTSPRLDSSWRYPMGWAQDAPSAEWELSARMAAALAAEPYVSRNWNGVQFIGTPTAPCPATHPADRPTVDERNQAIDSYRHMPVTVNGKGYMAVTWGGTSYKARGFRDQKLTKISAALTLDYFRSDLISYLSSEFAGKKIKTLSPPRTSYAIDTASVETAVYRWAKRLDDNDLFDGADAKRDAIRAAVVVSPTRIDINVPFSTLADLDVMAVSGKVE